MLTTLPVETLEDAILIVLMYAKRWRIEDWHRALKTCCQAEDAANGDAARRERVLAINMVIAWRIHLMTLLGRADPDLPPRTLFSDEEMLVLEQFAAQEKRLWPKVLNDYIILTAQLGGYLNRKSDGPPGAEALWKGLRFLAGACFGFKLFRKLAAAEKELK